MIRVEISRIIERLNGCCRHGLEEAASLCVDHQGGEVTVAHFLHTLLDNPFSDARLLLKQNSLDWEAVKAALATAFRGRVDATGEYPVLSPLLLELLQEAWLIGSLELGHTELRSGTVLLAILLNTGRYLPPAGISVLDPLNREATRKHFAALFADSAESPQQNDARAVSSISPAGDSALARFGVDFTRMAREGRIDPVLCRDAEIDLMIDILSRRRKNNPIAVGEAGVGKSALVEGLARRIVEGRVPQSLREVTLWGLDLGALQAGASVKGEFEKRLKAVIDEVKSSAVRVILFIDEAHTLIGAGNQAGGSDAANLLKPALARGELRTIAATTWSEYKKYFEKDPALSRRFQLVKLDEPSVEQTVHILRGLRAVYEASHKVYISDEALQAAAALSARYVSGRQLPDKAIDVLDTACARVASALAEPPRRLAWLENQLTQTHAEIVLLKRDGDSGRSVDVKRIDALHAQIIQIEENQLNVSNLWQSQKTLVEHIVELRATQCDSEEHITLLRTAVAELDQLQRDGALLHADVGAGQIAQVIADWTGIPAGTVLADQAQRLEALPGFLKTHIRGQDEALDQVHRNLLTSVAELRREGVPLGAFLLVGPSGVGKTETALRVAAHLFGGRQFLTTINMSEYQERHTVSRLIGSPPGYVGYGEGGILTEAIRQKPYSVVLLDEVEKAHPEVLNIFYQVFDKGEIADGEGRIVDCRNVIFFLTSNLGFDDDAQGIAQRSLEDIRPALTRFFKPALLARMQVVGYRYLDEAVLAEIVDARLAAISQRVQTRYGATVDVSDAVRDKLRERCVRHANGARMLDALLDGELLPPLSAGVVKRLAEQRTANGPLFTRVTLDVDTTSRFTADFT
jgi:type VI secretion system protein VasG